MRARLVASSVAVLSALVVVTPLGASSRGPSVAFSSAPQHVFPGKAVKVTVRARPAGALCSLFLRYPGAPPQRLPRIRATGGKATWQWAIAPAAKAGAGSMTAACGRVRRTRPLVVIGSVIPRRLSVVQRGWTARPSRYRGTDVTYGVVLHNEANRAAVDVRVLVNFVDARNRLFGSATSTVPFVAAGGKFALGRSLSFPDSAPIERLEVVIQVGSWKRQAAPPVKTANVRVFESDNDAGWSSSLEGELINGHPLLTLTGAQLSAVIFDAEGKIVGGAEGSIFGFLPPGGRVFFRLTSGMREVPFERAHSALISVDARYERPGA